jgi:hypothetical protein
MGLPRELYLGCKRHPIVGKFRERSRNIRGTFREHSGSIELRWLLMGSPRELYLGCKRHPIVGKFREHSGNIRGTFRRHSRHSGNIQGTVEQAPVSPHPNCKKHLKKVPRLTQNTTCPHEYLRRGLTGPNDVSQEENSVFTTCYHVARTIPPSQ